MIHCRILWLTGLMLICALPVAAQVSVELVMNQEKYMQYEPIYARVRLRNYSGQPLVFGKDEKLKGALQLEIVQNRRFVKPIKQEDFSLIGTVLLPGQSEEFVFRVDKYYKLTKVGHYTIHAFVRHAKLKDVFRSADRSIEVTPGVEVWRRTVGVPDVLAGSRAAQTRGGTLKTRSFSLRVLEERAVRHNYVVVEDAKRVYGVICIGKEVSSAPRTQEIDMLNRLHVISPVASRLFRYLVINLDGRIEHQEMLKREQSVPVLVRDGKTGQVSRVGGVEAVAGVDYKLPENAKQGAL